MFNGVWRWPLEHIKTLFCQNVFFLLFCYQGTWKTYFLSFQDFKILLVLLIKVILFSKAFKYLHYKKIFLLKIQIQCFQTRKNSKKPQKSKNVRQKKLKWLSIKISFLIRFMKLLWSISAYWCFQKKYWVQTGFVVVWYTSIYMMPISFLISLVLFILCHKGECTRTNKEEAII